MSAMNEQIGGDHYKNGGIQPFELSIANEHDGAIHAIQKYLTRFRLKGGREDLLKAQHIVGIRQEMTAKWWPFHYHGGISLTPREGIRILDYLSSWDIDPSSTQGMCIIMVESWHNVPDMDHEKTRVLIENRIGDLIAEEYPEEEKV